MNKRKKMSKVTNICPVDAVLNFLPIHFRLPLKFGTETLETITCARVLIQVKDTSGKMAEGWGETPLSVAWVWPSSLSYREREEALKEFCHQLTAAWSSFDFFGHPMEVGYLFIETELKKNWTNFNQTRNESAAMPWLAALVCNSAFDIAVHDAFGRLHNVPTYETYNATYMNWDLSRFMTPAENSGVSFVGKYPQDYFVLPRKEKLIAWHLVGGKDLLETEELTGDEPKDGYPVLLRDWIRRDGLKALKVKLRGNDSSWDYNRLVKVGNIAIEENVNWLTADFNCLVTDPAYVNEILDRLMLEQPRIYGMILYVEQPFPYELESHQIDVHSVSARKPLFMDESCHDWQLIKLGRKLGWTGVALKTCKTQTGALLSMCWARAHGMSLMVQDLTNPMLAMIPHVLLAAHAGTIMGVETNAMQFYPEASNVEARIHPGLYSRKNGCLELNTLKGNGFGYSVTCAFYGSGYVK
jgi:L-alanine-DL-glutamate epimerase-like enolase superfamily enzyme